MTEEKSIQDKAMGSIVRVYYLVEGLIAAGNGGCATFSRVLTVAMKP